MFPVLIQITIDLKFQKKNCCQLSFILHILVGNSEKIYFSQIVMSINGSKRGGECTSLNYNFHAWYEFVIKFSDNLRQKGTTDGIVLTQENKVRNLQIRYHF